VKELVDALVDRVDAAEREEHDGDYERPEVLFLAVAERVGVVSRPLGALVTEKEQHLVASIGERVDSFGQHTGASRARQRALL